MLILYFTATGNSLYVAKSISDNLYSIPQMIKKNIYEFSDDKIGIVFPLYEWSVNSLVADFLSKAKFNTNYLFAIITYGIFAGGVGSHLQKIAKQADFQFQYINKIKMVDNYLPGFNMNKQIQNEYKKNIEDNIQLLKIDINSSKQFIMKESSFRRSATKLMLEYKTKKDSKTELKGIKKAVYVKDTCIKCLVCTKVCPVDNIVLNDENKIEFLNKCFNCYSCLHNCPQNSIHIKNEADNSRFRNKNVSLQEIIKSNK